LQHRFHTIVGKQATNKNRKKAWIGIHKLNVMMNARQMKEKQPEFIYNQQRRTSKL
jgi:hypothetical protein